MMLLLIAVVKRWVLQSRCFKLLIQQELAVDAKREHVPRRAPVHDVRCVKGEKGGQC